MGLCPTGSTFLLVWVGWEKSQVLGLPMKVAPSCRGLGLLVVRGGRPCKAWGAARFSEWGWHTAPTPYYPQPHLQVVQGRCCDRNGQAQCTEWMEKDLLISLLINEFPSSPQEGFKVIYKTIQFSNYKREAESLGQGKRKQGC